MTEVPCLVPGSSARYPPGTRPKPQSTAGRLGGRETRGDRGFKKERIILDVRGRWRDRAVTLAGGSRLRQCCSERLHLELIRRSMLMPPRGRLASSSHHASRCSERLILELLRHPQGAPRPSGLVSLHRHPPPLLSRSAAEPSADPLQAAPNGPTVSDLQGTQQLSSKGHLDLQGTQQLSGSKALGLVGNQLRCSSESGQGSAQEPDKK